MDICTEHCKECKIQAFCESMPEYMECEDVMKKAETCNLVKATMSVTLLRAPEQSQDDLREDVKEALFDCHCVYSVDVVEFAVEEGE